MKKSLKMLIISLIIVILSINLVFAHVDSRALNLALNRLANASQGTRENAADALEIYLESDSNIDQLKRDLKFLLSKENISDIEVEGYSLEDVKNEIDVFKTMATSDRYNIITAIRNQNISLIREILTKSQGSNGGNIDPPNIEEKPKEDNNVDKDEKIEVVFKDIDKHIYKKEIIKLAENGIIKGKSETKFDPDGEITRAEFVSLIDRVMDLKEKNKDLPFKDIKKTDWYYLSVKKAYDNQIINGKTKTSFEPNSKISREEMAVVVMRVLKEDDKLYKIDKTNKDILLYSDHNNISKWARDDVHQSVRYGILEARDKKLESKKFATRAEASRALERVFEAVK